MTYKLQLKGTIETLKQSLAETEAKMKEVDAKLDWHGKMKGEYLEESMMLHANRKECLDVIALLEATARAQGEEV